MPTPVFEELLPSLPRHLRRLINTIEMRTGLLIDAMPHRETMACEFDRHRAVILVPFGGPPRGNASVFHELLHLKRYFVDEAPKLVCDDTRELQNEYEWRLPTQFARLDNQIEHLYIVPRELARYPAARAYWERRIWDSFAAPGRSACDVLLAHELVQKIRGNVVLAGEVRAQVEAQNLDDTCKHFRKALDESKIAATRLLFSAFANEVSDWAYMNHFDQPHDIALISVPSPDRHIFTCLDVKFSPEIDT